MAVATRAASAVSTEKVKRPALTAGAAASQNGAGNGGVVGTIKGAASLSLIHI